MTAFGIAGMAIALLLASAFDLQLGWPTCLAAGITVATMVISSLRQNEMSLTRSQGAI
jgi:hypothetical protein